MSAEVLKGRAKRRLKNYLKTLGYTVHKLYVHDTGVRFSSILLGMSVRTDRPLKLVQVGANDGRDPFRDFAVTNQCASLVIEANPMALPVLRESYAALPTAHIANIAISAQAGEKEIYIVGDAAAAIYKQLGKAPSHVTSFSRDFLMEHIAENIGKKYASDIKTLTVKTAPLDEVVTRYGFGNADALQVDTEGHDFEVLKSANLAQWRPQVINFEFSNLSESDFAECSRWLSLLGYKLFKAEVDCIAVLPCSFIRDLR
jgi:FkbM family methyltransferase